MVAVTVRDREEVVVEDSVAHSERRDAVLTVVVLTATYICALKHACVHKAKRGCVGI